MKKPKKPNRVELEGTFATIVSRLATMRAEVEEIQNDLLPELVRQVPNSGAVRRTLAATVRGLKSQDPLAVFHRAVEGK